MTKENRHIITIAVPVVRYQYRDHLGSSVVEANELGQVISYEEYYPYGVSAYQVSSSSADLSLKRYRFTGKERDEETGLDYFGLRYYASWLGRWTSGDLGGFVDGLNLYRYVRNNPVNGIDEEGYSTEPVLDNLVPMEDDCSTGDCDVVSTPNGGTISIPAGSSTNYSSIEGMEHMLLVFGVNGGELYLADGEGFYWDVETEQYVSRSGVAYEEDNFVFPELGAARHERLAAKRASELKMRGEDVIIFCNTMTNGADNIILEYGGQGANLGDPNAPILWGSQEYFDSLTYPDLSTEESLTPIYGSGKAAYYNFQDGDYARAGFNTMLTIIDFVSLGTIGKGLTIAGKASAIAGSIPVPKKWIGIKAVGSKTTLLSSALLYKAGLNHRLSFKVPTLIGPNSNMFSAYIGRNAIPIGLSLYGLGYYLRKVDGDNKHGDK